MRGGKLKKGEADVLTLLALAKERTPDDMTVARAAVHDILHMSKAMRIRIPLDEKRKLCRSCYAYLVPGQTSTVRTRKGRVIVRCSACGAVKRLQFRRGPKTVKAKT